MASSAYEDGVMQGWHALVSRTTKFGRPKLEVAEAYVVRLKAVCKYGTRMFAEAYAVGLKAVCKYGTRIDFGL
ncbi:MAG: hypothetical protein LBS80_01810 [Tannerella sp.]|jgi:hypothetical protein|nr:hypothetical protein [Tannerella sp.]